MKKYNKPFVKIKQMTVETIHASSDSPISLSQSAASSSVGVDTKFIKVVTIDSDTDF